MRVKAIAARSHIKQKIIIVAVRRDHALTWVYPAAGKTCMTSENI
jgi:hypothetical protein